MRNDFGEKDRNYMGFYSFWSWQYVQRNAFFRELKDIFSDACAAIGDIEAEKRVEEYLKISGIRDAVCPKDPLVNDSYRIEAYCLDRFGFAPDGPFDCGYSSEEIVSALMEDEMLERPLAGRYAKRLARAVAFRTIRDGDKVVEFGGEEIFDTDMLVAVRLDMPVKAILAELNDLLKAYQYKDRFERGEEPGEVDYDLKADVARVRHDRSIAIRPSKEAGRAVGLWLWDYLDGKVEGADEGRKIAAIDELRSKPGFERLGFSESEDRVFYRLLDMTDLCVKAGEVLSVG